MQIFVIFGYVLFFTCQGALFVVSLQALGDDYRDGKWPGVGLGLAFAFSTLWAMLSVGFGA